MKSRNDRKREAFRKRRQALRDSRWVKFTRLLNGLTSDRPYDEEIRLGQTIEAIFRPFGSYLDANTLAKEGYSVARKMAITRDRLDADRESELSERRRKQFKHLLKQQLDATCAQWDAVTVTVPIVVCLMTDVGVPHADTSYFVRRANSEGWHFLSTLMPKLEKCLLSGIASSRFKGIEDFASHPNSCLPRWLYCLWSQVFCDDGKLKQIDEASPIAVQALRQILGFSYKTDVPHDVELELDAVERFVATEEELKVLAKDQQFFFSDPILKVASLLCFQVFRSYGDSRAERDKIRPRHGPGITSDVPKQEKYEQALPPLRSVANFTSFHFFNERDEQDRSWRVLPHSTTDYFDSPNAAKLILVPKDARGPRIISAEPCANQWIQQGIRAFMYDSMESHPLTGGRLNFTDQSVNMEKAREASITGEWSTLDLKDASDRISLSLVRSIFSSCPELLDDILAVRSDFTVLPDGRKISLEKYAPMGSALCFPVLAFACWSIIVSGLIGLGYDVNTSSQCVYVYGDDIIVPTNVAVYAVDLLERYGLLVNKSKSFIGSRFAESCGGDYFDGNDVSIVRLRSCPLNGKTGMVARAVSILETANQLNRLGYVSAATSLYHYCERWLGRLPYGYPHSRFWNRNFLKFQGKDAWQVTIAMKPFSKQIENASNRSLQPGELPSLVVRTEKSGVLRSNYTTFGGHMLRIDPTISTGNVPEAGVFDNSSDVKFLHVHANENDFSEFEGNKHLFTVWDF